MKQLGKRQIPFVDRNGEQAINARHEQPVHAPYTSYWKGRQSRYGNVPAAVTLPPEICQPKPQVLKLEYYF